MLLSFFHCTIFCEDISEASKNLSRRHRWMFRVYSYPSWKYLMLNREVNEVGDTTVPTISKRRVQVHPCLPRTKGAFFCSGVPIRKVLIKSIRVLQHTQETPMGIVSSVSSAAGGQSGHTARARVLPPCGFRNEPLANPAAVVLYFTLPSKYKLSSLILRLWRSLW